MHKLLLLLLIFPIALFGQATITGKVLSMVNKRPVADASVFFNNTGAGSKTATDGTFSLRNVKNGRYSLVVSCIGYEPMTQEVTVADKDIQMPDIELMPKVTELREVRIKRSNGRIDSKKASYVRLFLQEFFGQRPNASDCKLLNPEMLDFVYDAANEKLTAKSDDFLIVENKALGYRIKYLLNSFIRDPLNGVMRYTGASVFEPMKGTAKQEEEWKKKRVKAYLGSSMHFLRACIANTVYQNDFTVFKLLRIPNPDRPADSLILRKIKYFSNLNVADSINYWRKLFDEPRFTYNVPKVALKSKEYVELTNEKDIYALGYPNILLVNYKHSTNTIDARSTFVIFNDEHTYFDNNGIIFSMLNSKFERYWADLRVADQLPADYDLPVILK